jgi:hypothetical protein
MNVPALLRNVLLGAFLWLVAIVVWFALVVFLSGCADMMARTAPPFQGVTLGPTDHVRDVPRERLGDYRCYDGSPLRAVSWTGRTFDIDCYRTFTF